MVHGLELLIIHKKHYDSLKNTKRNGLIPIYNSVSWNIKKNELIIFTDSGRLCRPVFYVDDKKPAFKRKEILEKINNNQFLMV